MKRLVSSYGFVGKDYTVFLSVHDDKVCCLEIKVKAASYIESDADNSKECVSELHQCTHKEGGSPVAFGRLEYGVADGKLKLVKIHETLK